MWQPLFTALAQPDIPRVHLVHFIIICEERYYSSVINLKMYNW